MGLFQFFSLGSSALSAQTTLVANAGRNVANASTPGYRRLGMETEDLGQGGVLAGAPRRADDPLLTDRERSATGSKARAETLVGALSGLEKDLVPPEGGLPDALAGFFASLSSLAAAPLDTVLRGAALSSADAVTRAFRQGAVAIDQTRADADTRISAAASKASSLASEIAELNRTIGQVAAPDPTLLDQRDLRAQQLTELTGGHAVVGQDGLLRFFVTGGDLLVDGTHASKLRVTMDPALGNHLRLDLVDGAHVMDVTAVLRGGKLAGDLTFRDGTAAQAAADLDQLAFDLATNVNTVHRANAGTDAVAGRNLFVAPAVVAGAAAALAVTPAVLADQRQLATALPAAFAGDNTGVLGLLALRDQNLAGGGTRSFLSEAIRALGAVGTAHSDARAVEDRASGQLDIVRAARDAMSGVSADEEMQRMAALQHATAATRHFLSTINEMLSDLMRNL